MRSWKANTFHGPNAPLTAEAVNCQDDLGSLGVEWMGRTGILQGRGNRSMVENMHWMQKILGSILASPSRAETLGSLCQPLKTLLQ